jgi:pimeloyl-ACP methyl ester carboxylesterase
MLQFAMFSGRTPKDDYDRDNKDKKVGGDASNDNADDQNEEEEEEEESSVSNQNIWTEAMSRVTGGGVGVGSTYYKTGDTNSKEGSIDDDDDKDDDDDDDDKGDNNISAKNKKVSKRSTIKQKARSLFTSIRRAPLWPVLLSIGAGYRLGVRVTTNSMLQTAATKTAKKATEKATMAVATTTRSRQTVVLSTIIVFMTAREVWRYVPAWIKRQVKLPFSRKFAASVPRAAGGSGSGTASGGSGARAVPAQDFVDPNDLTSLPNIAAKLQSLSALASEKLSSPLENGALQAASVALIRLIGQLKAQVPAERDDRYDKQQELGDNDGGMWQSNDPEKVLEGLDEAFEFADWAYNELPDEKTLTEALAEKDFYLLRHDAVVLPGSVAHYIAISKERKVALVGIKGTSTFEDLLTDCCGSAITHELEGPFVEGGSTEIRCHEGVITAAKRLADDLILIVEELLLPNDYKLLITGHSLGAGVAALVGVILRSRFRALLHDDGSLLKVLAFASPPILDYDNAMDCKAFTTTIVNNSDIIPRSSLSNLVVMLELLKTVNKKLEEKGLNPKDFSSSAAFLRLLTEAKDGNMLMTVEEMRDTMEAAFEKVELRDPDHLYVPGRVIHLYDLWSKQGAVEVDEKIAKKAQAVNTKAKEGDDENDVVEEEEEVRTAERLYVGDGASNILRYIEFDARMLTDHLSPGYRSSIKALRSPQAP